MNLPLLLAETMPEKFGLDWHYVVIQAVGFLILFAVLYRFAIKPVLSQMDQRATAISAGLKYAEEMKAKLEAAQQAIDSQLRDAQHKAQLIVADAQKASKDLADKQQKEAAEKAASLLTRAQESIELEKRKMLAEARNEIARLVVATTQRVLAKELTDADRNRYSESAARELSGV
jgi:F-type H+-transporting ATPase subunit b